MTTPLLTGAGATAGATVQLRDSDGTTVLGTVIADTLGAWIMNTSKLSDGVHNLTAAEIGANGAIVNTSATLAVTIDTVAPVALSAPTLAASSDSGVSSTDGITNDNTPTFIGIDAEFGAAINFTQIVKTAYLSYKQQCFQFYCTNVPYTDY